METYAEQGWSSLVNTLLAQGNYPTAVEMLRHRLTENPDDATAHAYLAICLVDMRRVHAAEMEARTALVLDPGSSLGRFALVSVCMARRRLKEAESLLYDLIAEAPNTDLYHRWMGRIHRLKGRPKEAEAMLRKAVELDPEDPDNLAELAGFYLVTGKKGLAKDFARQALELQPEHQDALVAMGSVLLEEGDIQGAWDHARWAIKHDATDRGALGLICAIKAKTNWFLGAWWRFNSFVSGLGEKRAILFLVGMFVVYRLVRVWAVQTNHRDLIEPIDIGWIGLCVYTWIGPSLFRRALNKELGGVKLDEKF